MQITPEKEPRRSREEEKVVKQWEKDLESERDATDDDEGSKQRLLRMEEQERRRSSSGGLSKRLLGDSHSSNLGLKRESMEIYRRISNDSHNQPSDDSQKQEKKPEETPGKCKHLKRKNMKM